MRGSFAGIPVKNNGFLVKCNIIFDQYAIHSDGYVHSVYQKRAEVPTPGYYDLLQKIFEPGNKIPDPAKFS
jgi:hypothetical protein